MMISTLHHEASLSTCLPNKIPTIPWVQVLNDKSQESRSWLAVSRLQEPPCGGNALQSPLTLLVATVTGVSSHTGLIRFIVDLLWLPPWYITISELIRLPW